MNKYADLFDDVWSKEVEADVAALAGPILVIGASGFIGSKLFFSLAKRRDDVFAASRGANQSWRLSTFEKPDNLVDLDILDFEGLKKTFESLKPKTIFNLSAFGAYSRQTDAKKIHETNYIGTLNLILAAQEVGCDAFVQAGTSSEYGLNCANPKETDELIPNSDYAVSKVGISYLLKYYGKFFNFPCANLRLYSIYGPWEEPDRLIPTLVSSGLKGEYPNFVNKDISRDFVYVDDCTAAFVRAALSVCKTQPGISVNIATGKKTTLEQVAKYSQKIFGIKKDPEFGTMENRKWDLAEWYGNTDLSKKSLKWQANVTMEEGLKITADWQKKAGNRLKTVHIPLKDKKISAIVACYKDNQSIPVLYKRFTKMFKEAGYDYEIIFVNDGSPYDDEKVIEGLSKLDNHVIGVSHSRNFGSQSAFVSGMEVSSGDAVVLMDGDGQDPPEIIPDFIKKWEEGFDIVYGQRVKREAPLYMQILYKVFYRIFKSMSDVNVPVDAGDFSLINRKAMNHLLKFREKDIFLRGLRAWIGFKQTGVPYERPERLFGKSTNNFSKNIWWAKKGIFSFSSKPLYYIQSISVFFFVLTLGLALYYFIDYFINPPQNAAGITTIILLVLGIGSIQLFSTSILGDYIGKITEEVKDRPKFIRSKLILGGKSVDEETEVQKYLENKHF
jgi:dolichol-phosphate mannosyltransferase